MPISQEVVYWSVVEQAKAIKEGQFTSRELLEPVSYTHLTLPTKA